MRRRMIRGLVTAALVAGWSSSMSAEAATLIGTYTVTGPIEETFRETGGHTAWGAPLDDAHPAADGGQFQPFERGVFYTQPKVNGGRAYAVTGPILAKWAELGWERSELGYPTSNVYQLSTGGIPIPLIGYFADTLGLWSKFQHGVIYWSDPTGAHPVSGPIYDIWSRTGYETGAYGYPVSDEYPAANGAVAQRFQHGVITAYR